MAGYAINLIAIDWIEYIGAVSVACVSSFLISVLFVSFPTLIFLKKLQSKAESHLSPIPALKSKGDRVPLLRRVGESSETVA